VRPQRLVVYIVAVFAVGVAAAAWSISVVDLTPAVYLIAAVVLAEAFAARLRDDAVASLTNVVILVAILVGSALYPEAPQKAVALGVLAATGTVFVVPFQVDSQRVLRTSFNVGQLAISAGSGGVAFGVVATLSGAVFPDLRSLLAIGAAALTFTAVNHLLVAGVIAIAQGEPLRSSLRSIGPSAVLQVPYVGIAVLAAVLLLWASPWALGLMAVPTLIARYGLLAFQRLDESYDRLVRSFVMAIEIKDLYTRGHSERVAELSVHVAEELGVPYDERRLTRYAALLHDVGKIGVPLCIINKPGPLDDEEFEAIKQHPSIGADILRDIDFLAPAIDIVRYHHERLDGRGYPHGIGDDQLSDIVRIVTAVDAFDAMTSTRSYRRALSVDDAVAELRRCAGTQFDPRMVEALASVAARIGWKPTVEFASEQHLHGAPIPMGTADERLAGSETSEARR
jgi:putative nucleotidyltransferase with HDIG domain